MDQDSRSEFCPRCQLVQPTFDFAEETHTVRRCQICGFPVGSGLTLDTPPPGFSSPPEVTVLCVDDDPFIRQVLTDALRFKGYRTIQAEDGESCLLEVDRDRPDLILLDVMMPDMDGFEVCRRLKRDPVTRDTPVILLTALSLAALRAGPESGFVDETPEPPDLTIPVHQVLVDFWTVDGETFQGCLRLHLQAASHRGPETIQDRLGDPELFLTLTLPGERGPLFLNKMQVMRVDVKEAECAGDLVETPGEIDVQPVHVQLINGEELAGTVHVEGPVERRRLSDFLNTQPAFLALWGPDRLHLLNKRFIVRIVP